MQYIKSEKFAQLGYLYSEYLCQKHWYQFADDAAVITGQTYGNLFIYLFIYLALPTRAGSPRQHMPITVGPFYLTPLSTFPVGGNRSTRGKPTTFGRALTLLFSHEDWVRVALRKYLVRFEPAASEVKGKCANHLATEAPKKSDLVKCFHCVVYVV